MTHAPFMPKNFVAAPVRTTWPLALWLLICCAMIYGMIVIGAITRLTESGLSIADWHAAKDMLPPLTQGQWRAAFDKYKATPEYLKVNNGMSITDFGRIYFWEWLHRLWGRLIGLVYAVPLVVFWARGRIPQNLKPRFVLFLALGGLQGFFGWYMVKSGLINDPHVSHYRLALHLGTAFVLLGLLLAQGLALWPRWAAAQRAYYTARLDVYRVHGWLALGIVAVTVLWGAFVAGLDAGLIYNEFPTMGGKWLPGEFLFEQPWWRNFLDNHATVQWTHRVLGTTSFVAALSFGLRGVWSGNWLLRRLGVGVMAVVTLQFVLGIATLLSHVQLHLAAAHQANAVLLVGVLVTTLGFLRRRDA